MAEAEGKLCVARTTTVVTGGDLDRKAIGFDGATGQEVAALSLSSSYESGTSMVHKVGACCYCWLFAGFSMEMETGLPESR